MRPTRTFPFLLILGLVFHLCGAAAGGQDPLDEARARFERSQGPELTTEERRHWLERSIAAYPTYRAYYELGKLHRLSDAGDEALIAFKAAFELTDQDRYLAQASYQIGVTHHRLGHHVEARRWLRRSLGFQDHPEVRRALRQLELSRKDRILRAGEILHELEVERSFGLAKAELRIHFELNEATLDELGRRQALELGKALRDERAPRGRTFLLLGHTDRQCPRSGRDQLSCDRFNLDLSERRAATVRHFLLTHFDLPAGTIRTLGCGRQHLLSQQISEDDHELNRRVVLMVPDRPAADDRHRLCSDDAGLL